ncbi:hypothetical protein P170DRAFT_505858 [Aspergillus steynii IBT 23096]|uniref:Glutamyl-tRNA synthetase n=1 Tax=Aspergillus steynii IBT 23096 TaxID=1392250 RepID=A0A2I2GQX7_9EURO|nr:uncharacterized protein P170DRAFT_505858 [Aspergillus steynii IBT 23096]PLB55244.1 hypothetical protein P170DRAFT_505858 [Aspergillus steynii IBT 23096]
MSTPFAKAMALIDAAHAQDPRRIPIPKSQSTNPSEPPTASSAAQPESASSSNDTDTIPYELHYAQKMTHYLTLRCSDPSTPAPSEPLSLAIRAQHLRRWEIPRASYPMTKIGYHSWRSALQRHQAQIAEAMCLEAGYGGPEAARVAALVRKEDLKAGDPETQVLEDVACLVFLDDQLEGFAGEKGAEYGEEKMLGILRKTWAKMSEPGRALALGIEIRDEGVKELVGRAVQG